MRHLLSSFPSLQVFALRRQGTDNSRATEGLPPEETGVSIIPEQGGTAEPRGQDIATSFPAAGNRKGHRQFLGYLEKWGRGRSWGLTLCMT